MTEVLTTAVHRTSAGPVLRVAGPLDYHTADDFRAVLRTVPVQRGELLVLDLAGLTFCDSSGITAFVAARNHALAGGAAIALAAVPPATARMLSIVGLAAVFPSHDDAEAAAAAATRPPAVDGGAAVS